jgi:predicted secreted protein
MQQALTEADNGRSLRLQIDDELELQLKEARMGGYQWTLLQGGEPELQAEEIKSEPASASLGERRARAWHFVAKQPGATRVRLRHRRPWEAETAGREFSLAVEVVA